MRDPFLETIPLNNYFAIQLRVGENTHQIVEQFFGLAAKEKPLFKRLEVLDTMTLGLTEFVRMRTDNPNTLVVLNKLHEEGRGIIYASPSGEYVAKAPGGRTGRVSSLLMVTSPKPGTSRLYRGTKLKFWERQFAS